MIWLGPDLTASEVISAQIRAERDTHPNGVLRFFLSEIFPYQQDHVWGKSFMRQQIDPKFQLTGTGSSFREE